MSAGGITQRLEGAVRTLVAAERGAASPAEVEFARSESRHVEAALHAAIPDGRDRFTRDQLIALDFGGRAARLAGEGSLGRGSGRGLADAFLGAALVDAGATRATAGGTITLDLRALANATPPPPEGPMDAITATRLLGVSQAADVLASGRSSSEIATMSALHPPNAASVEAAAAVEARLAALRTVAGGQVRQHDVTLGYSARARALAEVIAKGQEWDHGIRIAAPADLAAAPGSIERLRGVADRVSQTTSSLRETWLPLQRGELRPSDPILVDHLDLLANDLEEIAASGQLPRLQESIGVQRYGTPTIAEKARTALSDLTAFRERLASGDLRPSLPPTTARVADLVDTHVRDLLNGGTPSAEAGMAWIQEELQRAVRSPVQDLDGLANVASDVLERAALVLPRDLSFHHRGPMGQQLSGVLYRLQAPELAGQEMDQAVRARLDAAIAELNSPAVRLGEGDRRIPISADAVMGMPVAYLHEQRLERIASIAAISNPVELRAAIDAELARPPIQGDFYGPEPVIDALERVGLAARRSEDASGDAGSRLLGRLLASSTELRAHSGLDRNAVAVALGDAGRAPATRGPAVDAIMSVAEGASGDLAVLLAKLRGAGPRLPADLDLAGRLRARGAELTATLAPFGQVHDVRNVDRYVGNLVGIVDELDGLPPHLQEFAPRAREHALVELARGLEAYQSTPRAVGVPPGVLRLRDESLWPDRGRLGSLRTSLDLMAEIDDQLASLAPATI